jgi:hypothetical protein
MKSVVDMDDIKNGLVRVIKLVSFIALKQGTKLLSSASDDTGFYRK